MLLSELLKRIDHIECKCLEDCEILGVSEHSARVKVGDIFVCHRFVDRDLEKIVLPHVCSDISFPEKVGVDVIDRYEKVGVSNTGDSFVTEVGNFTGDVIDMEAFAQAHVCKLMDVNFVAVKYITDIIGQNSREVWLDKLRDAREALKEFFA